MIVVETSVYQMRRVLAPALGGMSERFRNALAFTSGFHHGVVAGVLLSDYKSRSCFGRSANA